VIAAYGSSVRPLVMLVDDEEDLVWTVERALSKKQLEFDLEAFTNPLAVLEAALKRPPAVLVTDVRMPEMNGIELFAAIRRKNPAVAVVVTTAFSGDAEVIEAGRDSSIKFLPKPYALDQLVRHIRATLSRDVAVGFSGSIAVPQLPDLIQIQSLARASQVLAIEHDGRLGRLWFVEGQVVHAECDRLIGTEAFFRLLKWPAGTFRVQPLEKVQPGRTIHSGTIELLMEGLRLADEEARPHTEQSTFDELELPIEFEDLTAEPSLLTEHTNATTTRETNMGNVKESLNKCLEIDGAIAAALVDFKSGMPLGAAGGGVNLDVAAAGNSEVVRQKMKTMASLGLKDKIEDILITLGSQYHLIRMLEKHPTLFVYVVLARDKANLAMARYKISELEDKIEI
jgi:DNA-binding NarL/FixJ family response regulator